MKSKNTRQKGNNRPLKWIVGLEFAGIILVGVILIVLGFRLKGLGSVPFVTQPTPTTPYLIPVSTSVSQATSSCWSLCRRAKRFVNCSEELHEVKIAESTTTP
jgi:hypothetical protein